jgi:hypothetical protein
LCESIRNDQSEWVKLEEYIASHSKVTFSHGFCPDCAKKHHGEFYSPNKNG